MRTTNHITTAVALAALLVAVSARAVPMMYSTGGDGSQLWAIDIATGAGTLIGPTGTPATYAAAWGLDGNLYTVLNSYSPAGQLGRFDLTTGSVTPVTGAAVGIANLMVLEFAPNGTLYAGSWATNSLYHIGLDTGLPTLIGLLGFDGVMDFAFDSAGALWAVAGGALYTVDTATGAGTLQFGLPELACSMGIAFGPGDDLFSTNYCAADSELYRIDIAGGSATFVGLTGIASPHGGDIRGSAVTEPGSFALALLGFGSVAYARRRKVDRY